MAIKANSRSPSASHPLRHHTAAQPPHAEHRKQRGKQGEAGRPRRWDCPGRRSRGDRRRRLFPTLVTGFTARHRDPSARRQLDTVTLATNLATPVCPRFPSPCTTKPNARAMAAAANAPKALLFALLASVSLPRAPHAAHARHGSRPGC